MTEETPDEPVLTPFEEIMLDMWRQHLVVTYRIYDVLACMLQQQDGELAERVMALHDTGRLIGNVAFLSKEYFEGQQ